MSFYSTMFKRFQPKHDPRHIEAYARHMYDGTLDHLSAEQLKKDAAIIARHINRYGTEDAEALAQSYGL